MNNFQTSGDTLTYTNTTGSAIGSGDPVVIGTRVGVAAVDIADTASGSVDMEGVFTLPKVSSGAIAQGAAVYLTSGGNITGTASGNTLAGYAYAAAADGATSIDVKLAG